MVFWNNSRKRITLWNNSRKKTSIWNNDRKKISLWIIFITVLTAAKVADFSQNGGGPTHTMEHQTNNFHSHKISISEILRALPFPSIKTCLVQEADQKVLGGLTSKLLMVGLWVHAMFYHYPQFVQVIFGLWNAFTVIRLCEEGKSAALPRKPPTLGWRTTWGQSTQGSLWRWSVSSPMEALLLSIGRKA